MFLVQTRQKTLTNQMAHSVVVLGHVDVQMSDFSCIKHEALFITLQPDDDGGDDELRIL